MREKTKKYYRQLIELSTEEIQPMSGDLGNFSLRLMNFVDPVTSLVSKKTGKKYSTEDLYRIRNLRKIYIKWQKAMREEAGDGEKASYTMRRDEKEYIENTIKLYLEYDFSFEEISEILGYSPRTLRNNWKREDYSREADLEFLRKRPNKSPVLVKEGDAEPPRRKHKVRQDGMLLGEKITRK